MHTLLVILKFKKIYRERMKSNVTLNELNVSEAVAWIIARGFQLNYF